MPTVRPRRAARAQARAETSLNALRLSSPVNVVLCVVAELLLEVVLGRDVVDVDDDAVVTTERRSGQGGDDEAMAAVLMAESEPELAGCAGIGGDPLQHARHLFGELGVDECGDRLSDGLLGGVSHQGLHRWTHRPDVPVAGHHADQVRRVGDEGLEVKGPLADRRFGPLRRPG